MDCAYVSSQHRVYVHTHRAEDLVAHFPSTHQTAPISSSNGGSVASALLACQQAANFEVESPTAASSVETHQSGKRKSETDGSPSAFSSSAFSPPTINSVCGCLIDTSTPATLHRDFYAWLQGDFCSDSSASSTSTASTSSRAGPPPTCCLGYAADEELTALFFYSTAPSTSAAILPGVETNGFADSTAKPRQRRRRSGTSGTSTRGGGSGRGTNLYGRPYCPGRPLSMDERYQIIQLFHAGMKVNAISKQLCISHGCVSKIITRFRETGLLIPSSHAECRRRKRLQMEAEGQVKTEIQQF